MTKSKSRPAIGPLYPGAPECAHMQAAIYCRKSNGQRGRVKRLGNSVLEQREYCRRDCESYGFQNPLEFLEPDGIKGHWWWDHLDGQHEGPFRPELTHLARMIEAGQINVIVVYKWDRAIRSNIVGAAFVAFLEKHGVRMISQGREVELHTARGRYQAAVDSAAAQQWRDQISEDIKRDHLYKAKNGFFSGNPTCLGFRSAGIQEVSPVWDELELVNRIFRMFVLGEGERGPLTSHGIAQQLMREGVSLNTIAKKCHIKYPGRITVPQVQTILRNVRYIGKWPHAGEVYRCDRILVDRGNGPETAVPLEIFEAAQLKLAGRGRAGRKSSSSKRLMAGIGVCAGCGRPLYAVFVANTDRVRWTCKRRFGAEKDCYGDNLTSMLETSLNEWVIEHLGPMLAYGVERMREQAALSPVHSEIVFTERRIEELRRDEAEKLTSLVKALDAQQLELVANQLREERAKLTRRLSELKSQITATATSPNADDLRSGDPTKMRAALLKTVRWIALSNRGVTVLTLDGSYIGAEFGPASEEQVGVKGGGKRLLPPSAGAAMNCLSWITDPKVFIQGRRWTLGNQAVLMTDEELLPGATQQGETNAA